MIIHKSVILKYLFLLLLLAIPACAVADEKEKARKAIPETETAVHAEPWAFGQSADRNAPIWVKGQKGKSLLPKKKDSASNGADRENQDSKRGIRSSWDLSVKEDSGTWKVTPSQKNIRPDETRVRENKHIFGAYADLEAGDDFNIKVGPELILKDDSHGDESANIDQPDSAFGLGMQFKYDF